MNSKSPSNSQTLYLGQNITVIDTISENNFTTELIGDNSKISNLSELDTTKLVILTGGSTNFNNVLLSNIASGVDDNDGVNLEQLNNEIKRAQNAEAIITTNLNNEITRAQNVEAIITTETERAQAAELAINNRIDKICMYFFGSTTIPTRGNNKKI